MSRYPAQYVYMLINNNKSTPLYTTVVKWEMESFIESAPWLLDVGRVFRVRLLDQLTAEITEEFKNVG